MYSVLASVIYCPFVSLRYQKQLIIDQQSLGELGEHHTLPLQEDITLMNFKLSRIFAASLEIHLLRINNGSADEFVVRETKNDVQDVIYNFNCVPEAAHNDILNVVQKSDNRTQDIFKKFLASEEPETWMQCIAQLEMLSVLLHFTPCTLGDLSSKIAQREDFDLKANALRKWAE